MALIESRSIDYVPLAERHGKVWHLWPIWFTGDAHLGTLATGALAVPLGLSFGWAALAIVLGGALGTFFMAFHSSQGPELGLPQMIQSRPQFGYRGALLVWGVALVTYVGYNVFNQVLIGITMHHLAGFAPVPTYVGFTVLAVALALFGYDWIHWAQRVLAAAMIAGLVAFTAGLALSGQGAALLRPGPLLVLPFLVQFFAAAAYQLSWSIYVSDYSRYLPRDVGVAATFWWTFGGAFIGGAWMMLVGAMAAALFPASEIVAAFAAAGDLVHPGFGTAMLVLAALTLLTATTLNFYGASLTLLSIVDSFRRIADMARGRIAALVALGVATVIVAASTSANLRDVVENLLAVLIYLFTPWTAINLVDFFAVRRGVYSIREIFNADGIYGRWNARGLIAYALGFAAMVPCFATPLFTGPVAKALGGADVSMLVGLPVAALAYAWLCRSLDLPAERRAIALADAGLDA
jgi:nucleobase:cation symporter-1, NCS1 family